MKKLIAILLILLVVAATVPAIVSMAAECLGGCDCGCDEGDVCDRCGGCLECECDELCDCGCECIDPGCGCMCDACWIAGDCGPNGSRCGRGCDCGCHEIIGFIGTPSVSPTDPVAAIPMPEPSSPSEANSSPPRETNSASSSGRDVNTGDLSILVWFAVCGVTLAAVGTVGMVAAARKKKKS
ncbi:MAG: hypothetical protein FWE86_00375 [Oscillospiraceae bacterium]|nr:hypothetical protein [Oscillospiraceae bacterium]